MTQIGARWQRFAPITALLCLIGILTGCTRFTDTIPLPPAPAEYALYGSRTIGQAFVCHHAGLSEISVLLWAQKGAGALVLHLREDVESTVDLATVTTVPPPGNVASYLKFAFPVQDDVNGKPFFVLLEAPDATAEAAVYIPYALDHNSRYNLSLDGDSLSPGQISFQLYYSTLYIGKDLFRQAFAFGLESVWLLFLSALFYLLPGGAAVVWLLQEEDWIERVIVALGTSVAIYALLVYVTMTGLRLNAAVVIGFLVLCGVLIGVRWWLDWRGGHLRLPSTGGLWNALKRDPSPAALALVFAAVLGVRIFVVRDLVAPMWGDGYHHTMIAQLIVDNNGLFDSWAPYAPLKTFTYHFGLHSNVALFHWLSGDSVIHSMIWIGQMLNALAVLALYPLALKMSGGNRWAGVGAVLAAGLLSAMPMYYVNWGRYTQLAGQVILPVLMWLTWKVTEKPRWDWRLLAVAAVALTGMGITHYRVVLIYGVFVMAYGMVFAIRKWGQWQRMAQMVLRLALVGCLALLLFLPWGAHMYRARIPELSETLIRQGSQNEYRRGEYNAIGDVSFFAPWGLLILSAVALAWQTFARQFGWWMIVVWVGGLLVLANPYRFYLPGTGLVNNFAVFIMFYIPAGELVGSLVASVYVWTSRFRQWARFSFTAVVALSAGWGIIQRIGDLDPAYAMVTKEDVRAMAWIRENTVPDAKFLINGFAAYGGANIVGADAGWWIPLLTGRENAIPPLTYGFEVTPFPGYRKQLRDDFLLLERVSLTAPEGVRLLQDRGITHVYIGQKNGKVGNPGKPLVNENDLFESPNYELLYHQDAVWIWQLGDG